MYMIILDIPKKHAFLGLKIFFLFPKTNIYYSGYLVTKIARDTGLRYTQI